MDARTCENVQVGAVLQYLQCRGYGQTQRQFSVELRQHGVVFDVAGFVQEAQRIMQAQPPSLARTLRESDLNNNGNEPLLQHLARLPDELAALAQQVTELTQKNAEMSGKMISGNRENQKK